MVDEGLGGQDGRRRTSSEDELLVLEGEAFVVHGHQSSVARVRKHLG